MPHDFLVPIEKATEAKDELAAAVRKFSSKSRPVLADLRLEVTNGLAASALNGNVKGAARDWGADIGVRVFSGKKAVAGGFAGKSLGAKDFSRIGKITEELLSVALKRSKFNSALKEKEMKKFPSAGKGLYSTEFAGIPAVQKEWTKPCKKDPLEANLDEFVQRSEKLSKEITALSGIATNSISILAFVDRKIFASSEGSLLEQTKAITEPSVYIAAKGKANETFHEWMAEARGLEVLEGDNAHGKTLEEFAHFIAQGTIELSNAPAIKFIKDATVVTDPWFNTLFSHEICGHPSEADRALKRETAWAGRAWWFNSMEDNQFGKRVGSEEMTIVSNPEVDGFGNFAFDDEGTPAKKVVNIEKGILKEFMNSRETAMILGEEPNGHMRASSASMMPVIRMSNTYFEAGSWKAKELIEDTRDGYYIVGEKTPSIGESRQNFNITCWKCYRIENGEIGQLYRNAGVEYDSRDAFMTIEAADDVKRYNVPNCGKGTPMQTMRVGNGGPHLRFKANITGERE
ncbi:MAG TPA: TldD/PmbA family protein [archaeon]|nr:TldD/PmbA family protein [archaeon]